MEQIYQYSLILAAVILVAFLLSFLVIKVLLKFYRTVGFYQVPKIEVLRVIPALDTMNKRLIGGGAGIIFVVAFILFIVLAGFRVNITKDVVLIATTLFAVIAGALVGLYNDILDIKGKLQRARIYTAERLFFHRSFGLFLTWYYLTYPIRLYRRIFDHIGSFTTGLSASTRMLLYAVVLFVTVHFYFVKAGQVMQVPAPLFEYLPYWFVEFLFVFLGLVFILGFNVTDGIDAISATNHIISFGFLIIISLISGNLTAAFIAAAVVGAELGFLIFNIPPAKIEMSDVGTVPLGILLVWLAYINGILLLTPLLGVWYFIIFLSSAIQILGIRLLKKRIFRIAPFHHLLELNGMSRESIVFLSNVVSFLGGVVSIVLLSFLKLI